MFAWISENKDLIGISLALIGLLVTAYTVRTARSSQRRDAFMRIHETLLQPEIQEGRRLLFEVKEQKDIPGSSTVEYQKINRSLAMYDTLGHYIEGGFVERKHALEIWHHSIRDLRQPAEIFISFRAASHRSNWTPWPYLRHLFDDAATYRSTQDCCQP